MLLNILKGFIVTAISVRTVWVTHINPVCPLACTIWGTTAGGTIRNSRNRENKLGNQHTRGWCSAHPVRTRVPSDTATSVSQPRQQQSSLVWAGLPFPAIQSTLGPNQDTGTAEPRVSPPCS